MNINKFLTLSMLALSLVSAPVILSAGSQSPASTTTSVNPFSSDRFNPVVFRAGEDAVVTVQGDGDTDLDLYVYDENGNLIAKDDDNTDDCVATFTPRWTGRFYIVVVNRGSVYNTYHLQTN